MAPHEVPLSQCNSHLNACNASAFAWAGWNARWSAMRFARQAVSPLMNQARLRASAVFRDTSKKSLPTQPINTFARGSRCSPSTARTSRRRSANISSRNRTSNASPEAQCRASPKVLPRSWTRLPNGSSNGDAAQRDCATRIHGPGAARTSSRSPVSGYITERNACRPHGAAGDAALFCRRSLDRLDFRRSVSKRFGKNQSRRPRDTHRRHLPRSQLRRPCELHLSASGHDDAHRARAADFPESRIETHAGDVRKRGAPGARGETQLVIPASGVLQSGARQVVSSIAVTAISNRARYNLAHAPAKTSWS